jgi:hypothetical protein
MLIAGTLLLGGNPAATAAEMQPGLWIFTQRTTAGGRVRQSRTTRCMRPAEAKDPVRYFAPRARGSACQLTQNSVFGNRISAQLRCSAGETSTDVESIINIDAPTHMTISTTVTISAQGKSSSGGMSGEGVRRGNCR